MLKTLAFISCGVNIFWGIRVLLKKPKTSMNVLFSILSFSMAGWCIAPFFFHIFITLWAIVINTVIMGVLTELLLTYKINITKTISEDTLITPINYDFTKGTSYIIPENNPDKVFRVFSEFVNHGVVGLCITRQDPSEVRKKYMLSKIPIFWLVPKNEPFCLDPRDLKNLLYITEEFADRTKNGIIILDGIEFLMIHNDFPRIVSVIEEITKNIKRKKSCIFAVSTNISVLGEDNIALFKKFMEEVE